MNLLQINEHGTLNIMSVKDGLPVILATINNGDEWNENDISIDGLSSTIEFPREFTDNEEIIFLCELVTGKQLQISKADYIVIAERKHGKKYDYSLLPDTLTIDRDSLDDHPDMMEKYS